MRRPLLAGLLTLLCASPAWATLPRCGAGWHNTPDLVNLSPVGLKEIGAAIASMGLDDVARAKLDDEVGRGRVLLYWWSPKGKVRLYGNGPAQNAGARVIVTTGWGTRKYLLYEAYTQTGQAAPRGAPRRVVIPVLVTDRVLTLAADLGGGRRSSLDWYEVHLTINEARRHDLYNEDYNGWVLPGSGAPCTVPLP